MNTFCKAVGMLGIQCQVEEPSVDAVRASFMSHINEYGHSYGTKEELEYRFQIYLENDKEINRINADPELTFTASHNLFSTLSESEMKKWRGRKAAEP